MITPPGSLAMQFQIVYFILPILSSVTLSASGPIAESVNFDFGWRFTELNPDFKCDASTFPINLTGVQCTELSKTDAKNPDDCLNDCCKEYCPIWQFSVKVGCYIGHSSDCSHKSKDWVGGGRNTTIPPTPGPIPDEAKEQYDDSKWEVIDVPHDGLISGTYDKMAKESHAYLPMKMLWYRKHFNLPSDWKGQSIWIEFQGIFRASWIYLNGQRLLYHDSGYTTFLVRLDNATTVNYGDVDENLLAVEVRPYQAFSGWWYEGGGIYRHTRLFTTNHVHLVVHGVYGPYLILGNINDHDPKDPTKGQYADAEFYPLAEIVNENADQVQVAVNFSLIDENGVIKGYATSKIVSVNSGDSVVVNATISAIDNIELWSITRTYLYKLNVELITAYDSSVLENMNYTIGVRQTQWDSTKGFFLNGKHFTWRGFNNHNDFTGVGVAIPDRINLFRAQMMRAVGANSWRMSHNPPVPHLLDLLDILGLVVWDENRNFGDNKIWMQDQRAMVKRDRNHPSIMVWSFCNENGCTLEDVNEVGVSFKNISKQMDSFRPVTANMIGGDVVSALTGVLDVQGLSHQSGSTFDYFHQHVPEKPLIGSECCSCKTQRGEDFGDSSKSILGSFNGNCNQDQTGIQLERDYVAGCMVWTLFDYYGEPTPYGWPMVSSSYGSIDLAGFAKPSAYWYRAWWYYRAKSNQTYNGYDVPRNPPSLVDPYATPAEENSEEGYIIHIVQHWEPVEGKTTRTIQAYTNAEGAELRVNDKFFGKVAVDWQGWAQWNGIPFVAGKITANALNADNQVKATHTVETAGQPTKVVATVEVPSQQTGTGTMLVLDGQDTGMISAAVMDASGRVVPSFSGKVTFRVVSGPGRITGVGNGNPACHEPNKAPWRSAYHGLARAVIQVTEDSASPPLHRMRLMAIDRDGDVRTYIVHPRDTSKADSIVIEASAEGLQSSTVAIPVTSDESTNGVLTTAKQSLNN